MNMLQIKSIKKILTTQYLLKRIFSLRKFGLKKKYYLLFTALFLPKHDVIMPFDGRDVGCINMYLQELPKIQNFF